MAILICPACHHMMSAVTVADVTVDVCAGGCGGIWFDPFELRKMDESHEHAGESLLHVDRNPQLEVDHERRRRCPRCVETLMLRHYWSVKKEVQVDECQTCAGHWLDAGELMRIRALFNSEADRKQAARDYFSAIYDAELTQCIQQNKDKLDQVKQLFRFITPSAYINGDKDG